VKFWAIAYIITVVASTRNKVAVWTRWCVCIYSFNILSSC